MAHNERIKLLITRTIRGHALRKGVRLITYSPPLAHPATKFPWTDDHTLVESPPPPWLFVEPLEPLQLALGQTPPYAGCRCTSCERGPGPEYKTTIRHPDPSHVAED
jgi:hypothetical protein